MLRVYFGSLENEIYDPETYFINQYEDEWITADLSRKMILDVDKSTVLSARVIDSPYLGPITPRELSGGVKTLILMRFDRSGYVFNTSACGNNCAKWILRIGEMQDLTVTLHHIIDFGGGSFEIDILNTGTVVHNRDEYLREALKIKY